MAYGVQRAMTEDAKCLFKEDGDLRRSSYVRTHSYCCMVLCGGFYATATKP